MLLTIFTAPKPFSNPHIARIQRNAIRSWLALGSEVEVILVGAEDGVAEAAREFKVQHLPEVARNSYGTPLIRSIFHLARREGEGTVLAYVNADILLLPGFIESVQSVCDRKEKFLIVGQRWDLDVEDDLEISADWPAALQDQLQARGRLHSRNGSDYFVFPRACFSNLPPMAVGRAGWDNWMIYEARRHNWEVVDASEEIQIVHQNHDYSHLPDGQPHYRLPETDENVRLGGGKLTIFKLDDASIRLQNGVLKPIKLTWKRFWREVEIFPLIRLHSGGLAWAAFALLHPYQAYGDLRKWMGSRKSAA